MRLNHSCPLVSFVCIFVENEHGFRHQTSIFWEGSFLSIRKKSISNLLIQPDFNSFLCHCVICMNFGREWNPIAHRFYFLLPFSLFPTVKSNVHVLKLYIALEAELTKNPMKLKFSIRFSLIVIIEAKWNSELFITTENLYPWPPLQLKSILSRRMK